MTTGEPTTISAIMGAISDRIVASTGYDSSQVFISLADDNDIERFPSKDIFVQIAPANGTVRQGDVDGGGNDQFTVDLIFAINLWVRLGLDVLYQDADQLRHATAGHLAQWLLVLKALQQYYPVVNQTVPDVRDYSIFAEPMRNLRFDFYPRRPNTGWAKLAAAWMVPAVLDLS